MVEEPAIVRLLFLKVVLSYLATIVNTRVLNTSYVAFGNTTES